MKRLRKNLKESANRLREGWYDDYSEMVSDMADSVRSEAERGDDLYEVIHNVMDSYLIYTDDQWAMIMAHFSPSECDCFMDAWDATMQDIYDEVEDMFDDDEDEEDDGYDESYKHSRKPRVARRIKTERFNRKRTRR